MKLTASVLLFLVTFFTVQPVLSVNKSSAKMQCCMKGHCKKKMSNKSKKGRCEGMNCNPFMGCAYCGMYILVKPAIVVIPAACKDKIHISNDNRTVKNLSDFWHPPNFV